LIRVENPALFYDICVYHGLAQPSGPPTAAVEFAEADPFDSSFTDSMSANHRRQNGKDNVS
jgi:hypothetical protein